MGQIDLFANYSYYIGLFDVIKLYVKKEEKHYKKNKQTKPKQRNLRMYTKKYNLQSSLAHKHKITTRWVDRQLKLISQSNYISSFIHFNRLTRVRLENQLISFLKNGK